MKMLNLVIVLASACYVSSDSPMDCTLYGEVSDMSEGELPITLGIKPDFLNAWEVFSGYLIVVFKYMRCRYTAWDGYIYHFQLLSAISH